jgi:uncharacterized protein (TIGR00288 family)
MDDIGMRRERLEAMVAEQQQPAKKFACLVDAENTQPSKLAAIMDELNGYGQVAVRRLYGDFSSQNLRPWTKIANELSFRQHTQSAIISGKNTTDIAMAIDAIGILHDDKLDVDGFALVSSDSDFTPLVSKLRECGKDVIGFGRRKTPAPLVKACSEFVYLEDLNSEATYPQSQAGVDAEVNELQVRISDLEQANAGLEGKQEHHKAELKKLKDRNSQLEKSNAGLISELAAERAHSKAETLDGLVAELRAALTACHKVHKASKAVLKDGWVDISLLHNMLRRSNPSWDVRNYGMSRSKGFAGLLERICFLTRSSRVRNARYFELKNMDSIKLFREKEGLSGQAGVDINKYEKSQAEVNELQV